MKLFSRMIVLLLILLLALGLFAGCAKSEPAEVAEPAAATEPAIVEQPEPYGEDNPAPIGVEQSYVLKSEYGSKEYKIKVKHVLRGQEAVDNFPPTPNPMPGTDYNPDNYIVFIFDYDLDLSSEEVGQTPIWDDLAFYTDYRRCNGMMEMGFTGNPEKWQGEYLIQFYPELDAELTKVMFGEKTSSTEPIWFSLIKEKE